MIGVPYATAQVVDGVLVHVCPVCQRAFQEDTDDDGEVTTTKYADHYVVEHGRDYD
jgi:hypothetical protein